MLTMDKMMIHRGPAIRCGGTAEHDSAPDCQSATPELPPRWLEMLTQLNQTFDAQLPGAEGH